MSRNTPSPGYQRGPRIADHMTDDLVACVDRSSAAERCGDAPAALEWHQAVPMFLQGRHRILLQRLVDVGDDLPPWVGVRWIVYQAQRCEDPGSATFEIQRRALQYAAETIHVDLLEDCFHEGGDPIKVVARVAAESWMGQQLFTHEFGGLVSYVGEFVTGRLAEHADLARTWAAAPLGGFRIGESLPGSRLRVYDAASLSSVDVLDLGARSSAGPEGWVLGRLVPNGVDDLLMFDVPPLSVSERIATEVAAAPEGSWAPVTSALEEGRLLPGHFLREDYELTTDVQELDLLAFGTRPPDLERVMGQLREGRDEVGRAAYRILVRAAAGTAGQEDAAFVAAAALNVHAHTEALKHLSSSAPDVWLRWADLVPEPGRSRLLALARAAAAAA